MPSPEILLKAEGINKSFSQVRVLRNVGLEVRKGEIHALMGENGAGKSTLIKILTGVYPMDSGVVTLRGVPVTFASRRDAAALGIGVIYQELSIIPTLTVAQNILLGHESSRFGLLETGRMRRKVQALAEAYGFSIDQDAVVERLSIGQRQQVEILKALSMDSSLLVMDEPTASLSSSESEILFRTMATLRERGVSIVYISHRLEEVYRLADRLTVLRDGEVVAVLAKADIIPNEVIRLMIGKELATAAMGVMRAPRQASVLQARGLSRTGVFRGIDFELHAGEILGLGGLVGSGRSEVLGAIFGSEPYDSGSLCFLGKPLGRSPQANIKLGIGLIPEDRRTQGFIPMLSVKRNIALTNLDLICAGHLLPSDAAEARLCEQTIDRLQVRPKAPDIHVINLSGGNQQKVVLGKWLARDLKVLLVDEPTAGIDVGAKEEIYSILEHLALAGVAVLLVSSDLQELLRISHRILVMRKGRLSAEFRDGTVTQEDLLLALSGLARERAATC